jgi:hypothetical protein
VVSQVDDDATRALEASGFVRDELHLMELLRDLEAPPPASAQPPGFRLATLATAGSAEASSSRTAHTVSSELKWGYTAVGQPCSPTLGLPVSELA